MFLHTSNRRDQDLKDGSSTYGILLAHLTAIRAIDAGQDLRETFTGKLGFVEEGRFNSSTVKCSAC